MKFFNSIFAMALVFATFSLTSCDKEEKTNLLVVHASPNAPAVDVLANDVKANSSALAFLANTGYVSIKAGAQTVKINAAGTTTTVKTFNGVTLEKDKHYTVFACDTLGDLQLVAFEDNLATPASGKAHVRFVHMVPAPVSVDIYTAGSTSTLFANIPFKSGTAFTPVDAGTVTLEARVAGTPSSGPPVISVPNVTLQAGKIYTVYAKGVLGGSAGTPQALGAQIITHN